MTCLQMLPVSGKKQTWLIVLLGLGIFLSALSGVGCSRAPEDPAWFQSTTLGDTLADNRLVEKINQTDSLFKIYSMKREYILRGGESRGIMSALNRRRDQLVKATESFTVIPGKLDFFGWDIDKVDDNKYRISCYFIVTGKMERNWTFKLVGKVDEKQAHLLPPENQKHRSVKWQVYSKTSTWDPGEHKIISKIVELQPVPYDISAVFYIYPEKKYGKPFLYGWFADVDAESVSFSSE